MGWGSAVDIFDVAIKAAKRLQEESESSKTWDDDYQALVRFAIAIKEELEDGDWDTQQESDYFEELKWDVFPEIARDIEEEKKLYGD